MGFRRNSLVRIAAFTLLAVLAGLAAPLSARAVADNVPHTMNFDGYLTNAGGTVLSGTKDMKFGLIVNTTRVWYAEYASVSVASGVFAVVLGDAAQGGISLDPLTGTPQAGTFLPISSSVLSTITSASVVTLAIEVYNGTVFETLSPAYPVSSALFALKADTVDGYDSTQLAKLDGSGNILLEGALGTFSIKNNSGTLQFLENDGSTVACSISQTGVLTAAGGLTVSAGTVSLPTGSITGNEIADNTIVKADIAPNAVTADKHFSSVTVNGSGASASIVADCGTGNVAISGGSDCDNGTPKGMVKSCPASTSTATTCDTTGAFLQYWLIKCASASAGNRVWATCMKGT